MNTAKLKGRHDYDIKFLNHSLKLSKLKHLDSSNTSLARNALSPERNHVLRRRVQRETQVSLIADASRSSHIDTDATEEKPNSI
jgi:hypothetical protein